MTGAVRVAIRDLFGGTVFVSTPNTAIAGQVVTSASNFTVGTGDWVLGNSNLRLSALFIGKGPGVCSGISLTIENALNRFATAIATGITPGASFELSELLLIGGGVGPAFKVGAARSA
jgi:hypothetical protein